MSSPPPPARSVLLGKIGLVPALSANILNMVGVGPFLTIPLVLGAMGGPQAMLGWGLGALIALCDGLVWAELGAAMPGSGGSYQYLRQAYGPKSLGRLMSFLFLAQTIVAGPLTTASGAVGFADYSHVLLPSLTYWQTKLLAIVICLLATFLLYRNIQSIGKISVAMSVMLFATMTWIVVAGATHFHPALAFDLPPDAFRPSNRFFLGLGAATLIAMYDYSGYFNVCLIGDEVKNPATNIPRCILLSIGILACFYTAMSLSIIGVIPWRQAIVSNTVVSDFIQRLYGAGAGAVMAGLIMVAAFGSVYAVLLGYSRVPYAAAREGEFFSIFARVHPRRGFPSFSVVSMGLLAACACLLSLDNLIKALLVIQILTQFIAQCAAAVLIRRRRPDIARPFSMFLYPIPVAVALAGWIFILLSSGVVYIAVSVAVIAITVVAFLARARSRGEWPWGESS